jgi:tRNA pseudouridine38-40 synthase
MRTLKLTVAYDGGRYVGWQRQASGESIQGLIEAALEVLEGRAVTVHGAGRTDAGVHALGQVATAAVELRHDTGTVLRALNAHLPPDIRIRAVDEMEADFHARFSARRKTYRYLLRTGAVQSPFEHGFVWHLHEPLEHSAMQTAAALFRGTHDFAAFRSTGGDVTTTIRTIHRSDLIVGSAGSAGGAPSVTGGPDDGAGGSLLVYEVEGDGFLRHMVRAIVGTLVDVGRRARPPESVRDLLSGGATRRQAGMTAPPHGLYLVAVDYD